MCCHKGWFENSISLCKKTVKYCKIWAKLWSQEFTVNPSISQYNTKFQYYITVQSCNVKRRNGKMLQ